MTDWMIVTAGIVDSMLVIVIAGTVIVTAVIVIVIAD